MFSFDHMVDFTSKQKDGFLHIYNNDANQHEKKLSLQMVELNHGTLGKYLFYSDSKHKLVLLAKTILYEYNLSHAKVGKSNLLKPDKGFGFVLCIYDYQPKFKKDLLKFADQKEILYRYWKSDKDTLEGKYSKKYNKSKKDYTE